MSATSRRKAAHGWGVGLSVVLASAVGWLGCISTSDGNVASATLTEGGGGAPEPAPPSGDAAVVPTQDSAVTVVPGTDGGESFVSSPACITYCNTLQTQCATQYPQYETMHACLVGCSFYPPGTATDEAYSGNTLKCRQAHAGAGPEHCLHGGPYGYGDCGFMCKGFCQIMMGWCPASKGGAPFPSLASCQAECELWPWAPLGPDGAAQYRATMPTNGDTLDCREVMLTKSLRSAADRDTYCPLAGTNSASCR